MKKTSISVIIPVYNEQKYIGNCLKSIVSQSIETEVIVVDDGSKDRSKEIISQYLSPNIKLIDQKHLGAGAARNLGVSASSGEILVFVDADMVFDKDFVKNLVKPIMDKKYIGTFSKKEYLGNFQNIWAKCWNLDRGLPSNRMQPLNYPDTQKVFRAILRSEFIKAGGFNPTAGYTDDYSLATRLGKEAQVAPGAVFYHANPDNLIEVFVQAKWMAKRRYKLGPVGYILTLLRSSFLISLPLGLIKARKFNEPKFVLFKAVKDTATFVGILEYLCLSKTAK